MSDESESLKPCPFCGCQTIRLLPHDHGWLSASCVMCDAEVRCVTRFRSQIITHWNRRLEPHPVGPDQQLKDFYDRENRNIGE